MEIERQKSREFTLQETNQKLKDEEEKFPENKEKLEDTEMVEEDSQPVEHRMADGGAEIGNGQGSSLEKEEREEEK